MARGVRITAGERAEIRRDWEAYRDACLESLGDHCRGGNVLTDDARARGKRAEDVFMGPWHHWETLLTEDALEWFAMPGNARLTFSDYLRQVTERHDTSEDEARYVLERLEELKRLEDLEGELLTRARHLGIEWSTLCETRGRSRSALNATVRAHNGGRVPC